MVDIADGFAAAMKIFEKVAEYETPTGLAAGMAVLRRDIEEAVRQMYIGFESIGKKGVEGAQLIAESAESVVKTLGVAVEAFMEINEYVGLIPGAINTLLGDIQYVLVQVRTNLLDLWGWEGERGDTVWGHMVSWSEAVQGVVATVGLAVESFTKLVGIKDFKGIYKKLLTKIRLK